MNLTKFNGGFKIALFESIRRGRFETRKERNI